jgi:hypothetical protein
MSNHVVFFGWDRPIPGREAMAQELFSTFLNVLETARKNGQVDSYEPVLIDPHGGDLNGFFLIRGEQKGLDTFLHSEPFVDVRVRAHAYLMGTGTLRGVVGQELQSRMTRWHKIVNEVSR